MYLKQYLDLKFDLCCICDWNNNITYANPSFVKFMNKKMEDLLGENMIQLLNQETVIDVLSFGESTEGYEKQRYFESWHLKNNELTYIEWEIVREDTEKLIFYTGRNVTLLKTENEKSTLLNLAFDRAIDAIVIAKNTGTYENPKPAIVYVNQTFLDYSEYTFDEVKGKNPSFMRGSNNSPEQITLLRNAVKKWKPLNIEIANQTKYGKNIWVSISIVPIKNNRGVFSHWISIQRDVTQRTQREEQLRIFYTAVKNSRDAIIITKVEATENIESGSEIIYVNDVFEKMTGFSKEEVIKHTPRILQGKDTSKEARQNLRRALEKRQPIKQEILNYKKNGEKFWVELSIFPVADERGFFTHWISIQRDITERKQAQNFLEEKVQERTAKLRSLNQKLQTFAAVASHDLKAPLRMINSYLEIFKRKIGKKLTEKQEQEFREELEMIDSAQKNAVDAHQLIQGILEYSNINYGKDKWEVINLNKLVSDLVFLIQAGNDKQNIQIIVQQLPTIKGNKTQIRQIFQNFITNAIKFSSDERLCIVELKHDLTGEGHLFSISDNGIGMHEKEKDKIFELFQRAKTKKKYQGQGLGLAICREIIENHHGRVLVESTLGVGSTFFFTLNTNSQS